MNGMSENLLLDTCAFIWLAMGGGPLSTDALTAIEDAKSVYVSSISAFEISLKHKNGGIELPSDPESWFTGVLEYHHIDEIVIGSKIAITSTKLPDLHKDPCDRFIIATAIQHNLTIVTGDQIFKQYYDKLLQ
jgi:PIN domain nuclease of toxin-antitoxin system